MKSNCMYIDIPFLRIFDKLREMICETIMSMFVSQQ